MVQFSGSCRGARSRFLSVTGGVLALLCFAMPAQGGTSGETRGGANAITVLVGRGTDTNFTQILTRPWTTDFVDQNMVGIIASHRLGTLDELTGWDLGHIGEYVTVEPEVGAAYRFGEQEDLGE